MPVERRTRHKSVLLNGATVFNLRERRGWTQEALAAKCRSVGVHVVSRAENGRRIAMRSAQEIAKALEVEPFVLMANAKSSTMPNPMWELVEDVLVPAIYSEVRRGESVKPILWLERAGELIEPQERQQV